MTRLLLINPNISDSVSALIRAEGERSAAPGTSIEVLTAPFGVAYIETRFEALRGG
jgi:allantoin racemase